MQTRVRGGIAAGLLIFGSTLPALAQSSAPRSKPSNPETDATSALQFLGSYSAPSAVLTTETSHTCAHPPSPPIDSRLRRIEGAFAMLSPWPNDFAWSVKSVQAACATIWSNSQDELLAADRATRQEQFAKAAALCDRILQGQPPCVPALWNHAVAEVYDHPSAALSGRAREFPAAPSATVGGLLIAVTRLVSGELAGAQVDLAAISPGGPTDQGGNSPQRAESGEEALKGVKARDILWARAMVAWAAGDAREARLLLARLCELEPESAAVWFELGGAALEEAWRLETSDPVVAFEAGDVEQRLGKPEPALDLFNQALRLDPGLLVARWSRGKTYLALGDTQRALSDLEAAVPGDSTGELQWQLARVYRKLGRADLAAQAEKNSEEQRKKRE